MEENKNAKSSTGAWQRNVLIALCAFLAVVFILLAFGTAYIHSMLNRLGRVDPENEYTLSASEIENMTDPNLETIDPNSTETLPHINDVVVGTHPYEPEKHGDHVINVLLVGQDRRPGEGRQRSDSMILVTFNTARNTITLTSFMRDQYVQIPGRLNDKLNAAYAYGGFKLLNETLKVNFGVFVDHNVEVDFTGFTTLIDLLGGVEITLTQAEADYMNIGTDYNLTAGTHYLTGAQALTYSRNRSDTDYRRAERQRTVLLSLISRYKNKPATEMLSILQEMLPMLTTDMSNSEILSLAGELLPMLSSARFDTLRIPVDGTFSQGDVQVREGLKNWFQYNIDFDANRRILQVLYEKD